MEVAPLQSVQISLRIKSLDLSEYQWYLSVPHSVGKNFWSYLSPSPDLSSFLVALSPATQIINKPKFGFKQKVNLTTMVTVTIDQDQHQLIDDNAYRDEGGIWC